MKINTTIPPQNILFFDTETTGLPADFNAPYTDTENWPRLVQLAWQLYRGESLAAEGSAIICPTFEIPEAASRIHGITQEIAEQEGVELWKGLERFGKTLSNCELIVAHNYCFDFPVVAAEMVRCSHNKSVLLEKTPWYCTKEQSTDLCKIPNTSSYRSRYKRPSLDELYRFLFNEPIPGREEFHDAMTDVRATARCYFEMQKRLQRTEATIL